jgi:hypothetical protein
VYVLVANGSAAVCEADDCTSLEVRIAPGDYAGVPDALTASGLGRWDGGAEVDLTVQGLHALAHATATAPDWEQRWTAMLAHAARSGWLAADGSTVRAHIAADSGTSSADRSG